MLQHVTICYNFSLNKRGREYVKYLSETPIRASQEMISAKALWDRLSEEERRRISDIGLTRINSKFQRSESPLLDVAYRIFPFFQYSSLQSKVEKLQQALNIREAMSDEIAKQLGIVVTEKSEASIEVDRQNRLIKRYVLILVGKITDSPELLKAGENILSDKELAKARKSIMDGQEEFGKNFFKVLELSLKSL